MDSGFFILEKTIKYIEDNILSKGTCYLPEANKIINGMAKNIPNLSHMSYGDLDYFKTQL